MEKRAILEILNDWNLWKKDLETGKTRQDYLSISMKSLQPNVVVAITGVRRAGKSYLMRQMAGKLLETAGRENILIVNFEDARFTEFYAGLLEEIYETYIEYIKPGGRQFVFLDEIHNVPKWERWVRSFNELDKGKIVISGSSSSLLSGELSTVLTGRHLDVSLFPLSFREFLYFRGLEVKDELDLLSKKTEIRGHLRDYMEFGGFPEIVLSTEKKRLLLTYWDDILTKDIEKRHKIRKGEKMRTLAVFYMTNISKYITYNSVRKFLDITTNTVEKYSAYLEQAALIFFVKRFHPSLKEQEKSPKKVFSVDTGLANAVGFRLDQNHGRAMENIVSIELKRRQSLDPSLELYYWKDQSGKEVDFLIKEGFEIKQLIQVTYSSGRDETDKRETRALLKASGELRCKELLAITWDYEAEEKIKGREIKFVPLWKWLLSPPK